jgi:hypothetical protein
MGLRSSAGWLLAVATRVGMAIGYDWAYDWAMMTR